ncbi:unnamed protein product [Caenorhabditis auriculariae]|uniref:C6 domain-containing protein n=1 Tax=Caenorhabditis auriculariae TaxID=2777116 RepID=A0A8S1GZB6_9PELO|nr:unnamed protein product [Caenorhabditis auriculariae]
MRNLLFFFAVFLISSEVVFGGSKYLEEKDDDDEWKEPEKKHYSRHRGRHEHHPRKWRDESFEEECSFNIDLHESCKQPGVLNGRVCFKPKVRDVNVFASWEQEAKIVQCRQNNATRTVSFIVSTGPISSGLAGTSNYLTCKHGQWFATDPEGNHIKVKEARCEIQDDVVTTTLAPGASP